MKIYIDNNVLIDYEKNSISLPINDNTKYYYSYVHIEELIELGNRLDDMKKLRLDSIETLTKSGFIQNDINNRLESVQISPSSIFEICMQPFHRIVNEELKRVQKVMPEGHDRNELINDWNINIRELNNYSAEEIASKFGDKIQYFLIHTSSTMQEVFLSFFNFLDWIGFWRDKHTERSNMARSYDACHAYFATYCDYFITNDTRTMNKANVVYQTFGYNTKAISFVDFLNLVSEK